jgi:hypothetical protein
VEANEAARLLESNTNLRTNETGQWVWIPEGHIVHTYPIPVQHPEPDPIDNWLDRLEAHDEDG